MLLFHQAGFHQVASSEAEILEYDARFPAFLDFISYFWSIQCLCSCLFFRWEIQVRLKRDFFFWCVSFQFLLCALWLLWYITSEFFMRMYLIWMLLLLSRNFISREFMSQSLFENARLGNTYFHDYYWSMLLPLLIYWKTI